MVGERLGADLRVELWRSVPDGQTDAGRRRAPVAYQPAGGQRPRHQRRRLRLCGRQSGGPAVSRLEAQRSVLQGGTVDDPREVQPVLSVPRDDGETRALRGDGQVGQGPRDPAGWPCDCGGYRVSVELPVWGPAVVYAILADAHAPNRFAAG